MSHSYDAHGRTLVRGGAATMTPPWLVERWVEPRAPLPAATRIASSPSLRSLNWGPMPLVIGMLLALGFGGELTASLSGIGGVAWRLGALLLIVMSWAGRLNAALAARFGLVFLPWLAASLIEALYFLDTDHAADFARQLFLVVLGATVYGAARRESQRTQVTHALFCAALLTAVLSAMMTAPILANGWSWEAVRATKNQLILTTGFGANSACFAGLIAALAGYQGGRLRAFSASLVVTLVLLSALLAARAPVVLLIVAGLAAWPLSRIEWTRFHNRLIAAAWPAFVLLGLLIGGFFLAIDVIANSVVADGLAGRGALWQMGLHGFHRHPIFGSGLHSYPDIIRSQLGYATFRTPYEMRAAESLKGGGFHNIWVMALVERGLIGLVGLFASYVLLFGRLIADMKPLTPARRYRALLVTIFVFLRGFVEITGLMSFADAALDAIVMIALAVTFAPEVRLRAAARPWLRDPALRPVSA